MNVKDSYSVALEDVPESITNHIVRGRKLISSSDADIGKILSLLEIDDESILKYEMVLQNIDELRQGLAHFDNVLKESGAILEGYTNYLKSESDDEPVEPAPVPAPAPQASPAEFMKEMMKQKEGENAD